MSVHKYTTAKGPRWSVAYSRPDGTRTQKRGFLTKTAAKAWETKLASDILTGQWVEKGCTSTLADVGDKWITRKNYLKPSSLPPVQNAYYNRVRPTFGDRRLDSLKHTEIAGWLDSLTKANGEPLAATGKRYAHQVIHGILSDAVKDGLIPSNPADDIPLPRKAKKTNTYLTARQLHEFAANTPYELLILTLGYTGMRWGEAIALTGKDVNTITRRISITKNAVWVNGKLHMGTPKTHENRTVPIPRFLMKRLSAAATAAGTGLLFHDPKGGYIKRPNLGGVNWFKKAAEKTGLPDITPHDLRHTAASLAVHTGANVKVIQRMLGHSSAVETLNRYADLFDSDLDEVADRLDSLARESGCV